MEEKINIKREFVATVYLIHDNKVLLTLNEKVNKWVPLGGHIEENELPHEAALREVKEESGYDIELIDIRERMGNIPSNFGINLDIIKPNHHHINLSYVAKVIGGESIGNKTDDQTEVKWFSKEELNNLDNIPENVKISSIKAIGMMSNLS